jgi:hypothetical protein
MVADLKSAMAPYNGATVTEMIAKTSNAFAPYADSDDVGRLFRSDVGHRFQNHVGRPFRMMSAGVALVRGQVVVSIG